MIVKRRKRFESEGKANVGRRGTSHEGDCRLLLQLFHRLGPEQGEAVSESVPG